MPQFEFNRYARGSATVAIATTSSGNTSSEINTEGFNAGLIDLVVSSAGTVSVSVLGAPVSGGTFKVVQDSDGTAQGISNAIGSVMKRVIPIAPYTKVVTTVVGTPSHQVIFTPVNY